MKIAVISDIHENFHNLILALESIAEHKVDCILCLGDLINAGIAKVLAIQSIPVHMIWGNNDGEKVDIVNTAYKENSNLTVALNVYDFLEIDNRKIFITHYDDLAIPMAESKNYDAVFYGHNHLSDIKKIGDALVVNPGELSAQKTGKASYALYDTDTNTVDIIELEGSISLKSDLVDNYLKAHKDELGFRSEKSFNL